jgi:hypothetical protein
MSGFWLSKRELSGTFQQNSHDLADKLPHGLEFSGAGGGSSCSIHLQGRREQMIKLL